MYERTTKLEETLAQFMQVSMSNHKSTESAIKNLEIQVGQLAKQIAGNFSGGFGANTEKNPKEECKAVMTQRKREIITENESRTSEEKLVELLSTKGWIASNEATLLLLMKDTTLMVLRTG